LRDFLDDESPAESQKSDLQPEGGDEEQQVEEEKVPS
jgi:hypothetical protein